MQAVNSTTCAGVKTSAMPARTSDGTSAGVRDRYEAYRSTCFSISEKKALDSKFGSAASWSAEIPFALPTAEPMSIHHEQPTVAAAFTLARASNLESTDLARSRALSYTATPSRIGVLRAAISKGRGDLRKRFVAKARIDFETIFMRSVLCFECALNTTKVACIQVSRRLLQQRGHRAQLNADVRVIRLENIPPHGKPRTSEPL